MLLLVASITAIAGTHLLGGLGDSALPPVAAWGLWTLALLACGLASVYDRYTRFHHKIMSLAGLTIFYGSYPVLWIQYVDFIPAEPANFAWANVFLVFNVIIPLTLVSTGPLIPVVRMSRRPGTE